MAPRGSWGEHTPRAKPMPRRQASAPTGPGPGPAGGGDVRDSPARAPRGVWADPPLAGERAPLEAQRAPYAGGMFGDAPGSGNGAQGVLPDSRATGTPSGAPGISTAEGQRAPIQLGGMFSSPPAPITNYEMAYGTAAPLATGAVTGEGLPSS